MRRQHCLLVVLLAVITGSIAASAQDAPAPTAPTGESRISVEIRTHGTRGQVVCALFANANGFPREGARAIDSMRVRPTSRRVTCSFAGRAPGTYAIAVFHDENSNRELDTGLLGIPSEGWGTSRNAPGAMGPPSWEDARFVYRGGTIRLRNPIALNY